MNGGKDIRLGHDKRQVSIVPNSEQNLYNFVTGEKLTDQFGIPVIVEVDTYYLADATAKRSSSIVFDGTKNPYTKQNYQIIGICSAVYGDYDVYLSQPFTILQTGGGTVSVSSTVLTSSGYVILGDFPYQEVNTSVDQGSEKNKLYFNTSVGISTILGVSVGDFVSGPDIPDGTYVTKVSYNSRLTLSNNTTNSLGQSKDILIQRKNIFTAKADPVWKIAEQFKETSEVSTTLLGINRAETQLALFANVSSYGLDPDDFETYSYNEGNSFGSWETRKNAIYGNRYTATITEETQESAIKLTAFPTPYSYPYGPKFEKLGLYNKVLFDKYIDFIEWGNALYDYFDTGAGSSYPAGWKDNFLSSEFAYSNGSDIVYPVGFADGFAQIDTWTDTWRKLGSENLIDPTNGSIFDGSVVNGYTKSSTQPGYSDRDRRYAYLQSKKVFRYQPGRISGFTFGLRSSAEPVPGITLEWGIANNTDQYIFQINEGNFSIVRRSTVPLDLSVLKRNGLVLSDQPNISSDDPFDTKLYHTIKIPTDNFNGDVLNGNGPSGYKLKPENVTMYKIEFGWYGAIGARFYAYIPTDNGDARWVVIHTLVIENSLDTPCLRDSYFRFKYSLNISNTGNVETPQYLYKYGASYYIDGGDEGTSQIYSAASKQKTIKTTHSKSLIGIFPKEYLLNREGEEIKNKKLIIPESLNVSTDSLTEVKVVTCSACPGFGHVYTPGVATTENGRYIDAVFDAPNRIISINNSYFTESDVGAKIIAPSIYNAYISSVTDRESGTDNYIKAELKRFGGTFGFELETNPIGGELVFDRVLGITTTIGIGIGNTYPHQIRLSNYDATAASNFAFTGSKIEIQFVNPNNKDDYAHWADFLIGVTNKEPKVDIDTLDGFTLPGIGDTTILPNSQILYGEHTHSYAASNEDGVEISESWALIQPPLRMGIDYRIPTLSGIGTLPTGGICSKLTVDVLDPLEIKNVNQRDYLPGTTIQDGRTWIEIAGEFDPSIDFDGGQIVIRNAVNSNVGISANGLVLNLDAGNDKNSRSSVSTNLVNNGSFVNGAGSSNEEGSNPTNAIVQLENPGESPFVLRQNGNNTEYQLNIDSGMIANTTYVMSGWYAKSSDYNGGDTMFHARAFSSSGDNTATEPDTGTLIRSITIGSTTWEYRYQTITTPSDFNGAFDWYLGYGTNNTTGYRYYTNLKVEKGTFPSLLNMVGDYNHGTLINGPTYSSANGGSIVFDGVNDYATSGALSGSFASFTVIIWFYPTSVANYQNPIDCNYAYNGSTGNIGPRLEMNNSGVLGWVYSNATGDNSSFYAHNVVSSGLAANTWHCAAITYDGNTNSSATYFNGNPTGISRITNGNPTGFVGTMNNVTIGKGFHLGGAERFFAGRVSNVSIYNRVLSATEVAQNYNSIAGIYDLPLVATTVSIPTTENITRTNSYFVGVTSSYKDSQNKQFSYIQISPPLSSTVGSNFTILIRPVSITGTTIYKQKLYNYDPWPLYLVAKLKDNAAINNITVKETIGDFQRTISPKWYVSDNCTVTTADGNADPTGAAPTNFQEIDRSSSALIDIQNEQKLRPYIERDTLYVGANSTETINMRKVFGPDRSVITPDNNNIEATFILAKKIEEDTGPTGTIEASINFKES
jgi:hypothetical protein